jgi:hypothetical protein
MNEQSSALEQAQPGAQGHADACTSYRAESRAPPARSRSAAGRPRPGTASSQAAGTAGCHSSAPRTCWHRIQAQEGSGSSESVANGSGTALGYPAISCFEAATTVQPEDAHPMDAPCPSIHQSCTEEHPSSHSLQQSVAANGHVAQRGAGLAQPEAQGPALSEVVSLREMWRHAWVLKSKRWQSAPQAAGSNNFVQGFH